MHNATTRDMVRIAATTRVGLDSLTGYCSVENLIDVITAKNTIQCPAKEYTLKLTTWVIEEDERWIDHYVQSNALASYRGVSIVEGDCSGLVGLVDSTSRRELDMTTIEKPTLWLSVTEYRKLEANPSFKISIVQYNMGRLSIDLLTNIFNHL